MRPGRHIVIIGSGFGGLAAAIRLQATGYQVTVIEAREKPGGRAYQLVEDGYTFDMGPSLITAPHLLEELWTVAGRDVHDDLRLMPLSPYYRIYFQDGRSFDYGSSPAHDEAEIAKFNPDDVDGFRAFLGQTEQIYERAFDDLAGQPFDQLRTFLGVGPELVKLGAHRSVYQLVSKYISDPNLRMAFSFHPMFIGGNPLRASSIYAIIPYLERQGGVHFAMGGLYSVVEAMERLFTDLGGQLICNESVERIDVEQGRVSGVGTASGAAYRADIVVANSDVASTYLKLLPPQYRKRSTKLNMQRYRYSMSCFLLYLGLDRQYDKLLHHTVIMPGDFKRALAEIFDGDGLPEEIALYLHAPTKSDASLAPPGGESLYALVPVPNLAQGIDWRQMAGPFRDRIIRFLEHDFGLSGLEESIVVERQFTPLDFESELRSWQGSAFSIEPTLLQSAYFRPHNRSRDVTGLYFVGAGTHPGAGIPGVLMSAEITSQLVHDDFPAGDGERIISTQLSLEQTDRLLARVNSRPSLNIVRSEP